MSLAARMELEEAGFLAVRDAGAVLAEHVSGLDADAVAEALAQAMHHGRRLALSPDTHESLPADSMVDAARHLVRVNDVDVWLRLPQSRQVIGAQESDSPQLGEALEARRLFGACFDLSETTQENADAGHRAGAKRMPRPVGRERGMGKPGQVGRAKDGPADWCHR